MADTPPNLRWNILSDAELTNGANDAFGVHSAYARLLRDIATQCPSPFSIGLYSSWGTGKTSIVRLLQEMIDKDPTRRLSLVYLDVWKYSSDPLKRWVIFETERQLTEQKLLNEYKFENRSIQSHLEFEEELQEKDKLEIDFKNFGRLLIALLLVVALCGVGWFYVPASSQIREALRFLFALSAGGGVVAIIITAALKKVGESMSGLLFRRTLKHTTAKPVFSSEKFGQIFRDVVARATGGKDRRRLVFVFDNLDRCQVDVAVEAIGAIKTFLDEPGCVYIVPCDEEAILTHIKASFLKSSEPEASDAYANQFLTKLFQMTLRLPPAADFAVEDYLDKELKEAKMEDLSRDARDVLVLGYRGETPRQVKRVLNDLIAYRSIAEQIEADGLVERGALTTDLGHLTKMAVLSTRWPSFMRRLAEDPILWTDTMQRIRSQMDLDDIESDLHQFLWNTRLVSPDVDIRPWLYFRRGTLEKDASLHNRIEAILQNGAWKQFLDLLVDESLQDKNEHILQIATTTVRRWLTSHRRVLLRNGCPVVLKASLQVPDNSELRRATLDAIDYLATDATPDEIEQLFDVKDILSITRTVHFLQRKKLLTKYTELFDTKYPTTESRMEIWKQLIQHGDLLDQGDRNTISNALISRYTQPPSGESDVLSLILIAAEDLPKRDWCIKSQVLDIATSALTFDGGDQDKKRVAALLALITKLPPGAMRVLVMKITQSIDPARTSQADTQAQNAISALIQISVGAFGEVNTKPVTDALLAQAGRSPVPARLWWLAGILHMYRRLTEADYVLIDGLFKSTFVDANPAETLKLHEEMHKSWRKALLGIARFRSILKTQAANYQSRFGSNAPANREQQLGAFDPLDVLQHPDIFDESFSWDLAIFVRTIRKALAAKAIDEREASKYLGDFCTRHLAAAGPAPNELYSQTLDLLTEFPETASTALSEIIVKREMVAVLAEDYSAYTRFKQFKSLLVPARRLELDKELMQTLSARKGKWDQLLGLLINDVREDKDASKDHALVIDLADYTFSAAQEKWAETTSYLSSIVPLLDHGRQEDYVDRSLEALLALEADGDDLVKMEPFLRLIETEKNYLEASALANKATKLIQRMLGAGKPDPAKARILQFTSGLNPGVINALRPSIEQLTQSSDPQVAAEATSIAQKLEPREPESK